MSVEQTIVDRLKEFTEALQSVKGDITKLPGLGYRVTKICKVCKKNYNVCACFGTATEKK